MQLQLFGRMTNFSSQNVRVVFFILLKLSIVFSFFSDNWIIKNRWKTIIDFSIFFWKVHNRREPQRRLLEKKRTWKFCKIGEQLQENQHNFQTNWEIWPVTIPRMHRRAICHCPSLIKIVQNVCSSLNEAWEKRC